MINKELIQPNISHWSGSPSSSGICSLELQVKSLQIQTHRTHWEITSQLLKNGNPVTISFQERIVSAFGYKIEI